VTKAVTIENLLDDQSTMPIENSCGADGSRTHHLLKAVNLNLFQGFPFLEEVSSVLTTDSQSFAVPDRATPCCKAMRNSCWRAMLACPPGCFGVVLRKVRRSKSV